MKKLNILIFSFFGLLCLSSCSDMLETDSELVEFESDNTLSHPTDSVYSVLGIVSKLQDIIDRVVVLGEARADLVTVTAAASSDLRDVANFQLSADKANKYNVVADYYAVINNCNYYLAHVDTAMTRRGRKLFISEYGAVKVIRAWTYLQLGMAYGKVPYVTRPLMTEADARDAMNGPRLELTELCDELIQDLQKDSVANILPLQLSDKRVAGHFTEDFFYPAKVILGDLNLWAGHYQEAARWYHEFLNDKVNPVTLNVSNRNLWSSNSVFLTNNLRRGYTVTSSQEVLSYIPMENIMFEGVVSELTDLFESTDRNYGFFQLTPSDGMRQLSAAQNYCMEHVNDDRTQIDTIYIPKTGLFVHEVEGDLRLYTNYSLFSRGSQDAYSEYSSTNQYMNKLWSDRVPTCRRNMVYLRYAEALNRAGFPQSAVVVLKCGLCDENNQAFIDDTERQLAGDLISFDPTVFTKGSTIGIHAMGCGDTQCDTLFRAPLPDGPLPSRQDTVNYQIPRVEDMIITEMALEGSFEGYRFYDLLRVALRRGAPEYLADPVSCRMGESDATLRSLLMNKENWFLPLP